MPGAPVLDVDVEVDRRDFTVRASLTVAPGERLALFGPSGAGKTTLLEVIAGLVVPRRARITLAGRVLTSSGKAATAVPPWQRRVGLLRQDPGLFPHLSVRDNLLYGRPGQTGRAGQGNLAELAELSEILGIAGLLGAMPARLSGGQAHRVALGRLLLAHCDALLLDEPYTGLDASLRRTLTDLVVSLVGRRRVPSVLVAHELAETQAFADRLAVLDRGQILQVGSASEVVLRPASRRVAELVGYTGFVLAPGAGTGAADTVAGVHPDRVTGGRHPDRGLVLAGAVTGCRPAGALWEVTVRVAGSGATVIARLPEAAPSDQEIVLTVLDPPCFGPDGTAVGIRASARVPR
jgi:molybdate transport system ATP-binding protein